MSEIITTPEASETTEPTPEPAHKPLYRSRRAWIVAIVALVAGAGLAFGLLFTVFAGSAPTPESIVTGDHYSVITSMDQSEVNNALSTASDAKDVQFLKGMFTSAAVGTSGSNEEVAFGLTSKGQSFIGTLLPLMSGNMDQGMTAHLTDGGKFLVVQGPAKQFNGTGSAALGF
jgi:hypothetical protein